MKIITLIIMACLLSGCATVYRYSLNSDCLRGNSYLGKDDNISISQLEIVKGDWKNIDSASIVKKFILCHINSTEYLYKFNLTRQNECYYWMLEDKRLDSLKFEPNSIYIINGLKERIKHSWISQHIYFKTDEKGRITSTRRTTFNPWTFK